MLAGTVASGEFKEQSYIIESSYQMCHRAENVYPSKVNSLHNEKRQDAESTIGNTQVHPH